MAPPLEVTKLKDQIVLEGGEEEEDQTIDENQVPQLLESEEAESFSPEESEKHLERTYSQSSMQKGRVNRYLAIFMRLG